MSEPDPPDNEEEEVEEEEEEEILPQIKNSHETPLRKKSSPDLPAKRSSILTTTFSAERIEQAEELLPKMNLAALEKLKGFLRTKAESVKRNLDILTKEEAKLTKVTQTLQAENAKFAGRKKRAAAALTLMRDNLCKIPGFNCKTFEMRGQAVVRDTIRDQWLAKGEMLEVMENLIQEGIQEDKELSEEMAANEKEWRTMMTEYLHTEEQIAAARSRYEDLQTQSRNYEQLVEKLDEKVRLGPVESEEDRTERIKKHQANSAGLRARVTAPIPEEYTEDHITRQIGQFVEYTRTTETTLESMRDTVAQLQAFDDIRQHALQMVITNGGIPGRHGIDHGVWAEIVKSSLKMSKVELEEKIKDLNDMTTFKLEAFKNQIKENESLLVEERLTFTPRRTTSFEFDVPRSQLKDSAIIHHDLVEHNQ